MRIVDTLKNSGHVVAVTGDGVNDAPALKAAHIGIAMGIVGTEVARAASDMVLLDDNFASLVSGIEEGRAVFQNIRKFLTYVLVHNVTELVPYLAFILFPIPLPLTPIQILAIDMGTDSPTALGLGVEEPHPQAMQQPPRPQKERLMNFSLGPACLPVSWPDRSRGGFGSILVCPQQRWVDTWANSGANRFGLSERHDSVSQRDHRFADRQRISMSQLGSVGVFQEDFQ